MASPVVAAKAPIKLTVEGGTEYWWCDCGHKGSEFSPVKFTPAASGDVWFCACKHSSKAPMCDGTHKTV